MRQDVIDYLQTLNLGTFIVSNELPFSESGTPLYIKNLKKIYVDVDQSTVNPVITTLDGVNVTVDSTAIKMFFANDAKSIPANYDEVVTSLKSARNILSTTSGISSRRVDVTTDLQADRLITQIELRFIKLT